MTVAGYNGAVARPERQALLQGPIGPTLIRMALPMVIGIASIIFFNIVDTFWVGRLGDDALAAMSFTFPVVFVVMSLAMGLGIGTTSVLSRAIGAGDRARVRRLTSDSLLLSLVLVVAFAGVGLATLDPLFAALGASPPTRALIREYMVPWYLGVGLLVIPMVGNSAIRATGDTRTPSIVMMVAGFVNAALDPVLIFGWGPIPAMELRGAAIATIFSYAGAMVAAIYLLSRKLDLIEWSLCSPRRLLQSWKQFLAVGAPAAATNMMTPLASGVVTRILAGIGPSSVAAYGVGTRIEALALIGINAMTIALAPFVGQNHGAKEYGRVARAVSFATWASLALGAVGAAVLALARSPIASIFTDDPVIAEQIGAYFLIIPVSYGLMGVAQLCGSAFNAVNRPLVASVIVAVRLFVLALPLAYLGAELYGARGVFAGMAVGNVAIGILAWFFARRAFIRAGT